MPDSKVDEAAELGAAAFLDSPVYCSIFGFGLNATIGGISRNIGAGAGAGAGQ